MKRSALFCALLLFASAAVAFEFRRATETHEEMGFFLVCLLEEPRASYAFRPAFDWDTTFSESSQTVTLAPKKDLKSWITIRLAASTNSPAAGIRAYLRSAFPKAEVVEEFTMRAASKDADAIDFTDPSAGAISLKRRLVLLPSPSGIFEFLLSSRPDDFDSAERVYGQLLGSLEFRGPPEKPAAQKSPADKPAAEQAR